MRRSHSRGAAIAAAVVVALAASIAAGPTASAVPAKKAGPVAGASIIGGGAADPARWPFMAAILRKGNLQCGGSVIAPTKVLTAGHCVRGFNVANLTTITGSVRYADPSAGQEIPVLSAIVHPDYATSLRHDVAVLTLASPTTAPPIELPTVEQAAGLTGAGQLLRVAGWGARHPLGLFLPRALQRTTEKVRTNRRCRRSYRSAFSGRSMICALGRRLQRSRGPIHTTFCAGDSGGPLVADTSSGPLVVGIVSYSSFICGFSGGPSVYARVSDALPFIEGGL